MRTVEQGVTQFGTVGIDGRVALPVGIRYGRSTIVDGIGVAKGIGRHQVEAEVEMFLQLAAHGVGVALIGIGQGDDSAVRDILHRIVRSDIVRIGRCGVDAIDHTLLAEGQVLEEDVVQGLGPQAIEGELPAVGEDLLETEVGAEDLRILEVAVQGIDGRLAALLGSDARLDDVIVRVAGERELAVFRLVDPDILGFHTRIVVGIGDPDERDTAGEEAGATTQQGRVAVIEEPAEAQTRRPERSDLRDDTHLLAGRNGDGIAVEVRVLGRLVQQDRHIDAQTVGQGQVGVRLPLILRIETELGGIGRGTPVRGILGAGHGRIGIPVVEGRRRVVEIIRQGSELILAESILQEEVVEAVDFIMGTKGQFVLAQVPAQVVRNRVRIGVHGVAAGGILRTDVDIDTVLDVVVRTPVRDLAVVADEDRGRAEHVGNRRADPGVEFRDQGIGLVDLQEGRIVEIVGRIAGAVTVLEGIHVLVADHQLVGFVDVPVQARQDVVGTDVDLVLLEILARVADLVGILIETDEFLGKFGGEILVGRTVFQFDHAVQLEVVLLIGVVGRRVNVRPGVLVVLAAQEEEELVLDDRTAHRETEGLGELLLVLGPFAVRIEILHLFLVAGRRTDHVLVGVVGIDRTLDRVRTGLGDGVDGTARETGLAHVERRHDDLDLFDGIQGDRVGVRLAAVGTGR